jgi:ABC-2 type transport system ATP-binding protein
MDASAIGDAAAAAAIPLHGLTPRSDTLEDVYLAMTSEAAEYEATTEKTERP